MKTMGSSFVLSSILIKNSGIDSKQYEDNLRSHQSSVIVPVSTRQLVDKQHSAKGELKQKERRRSNMWSFVDRIQCLAARLSEKALILGQRDVDRLMVQQYKDVHEESSNPEVEQAEAAEGQAKEQTRQRIDRHICSGM